MRTFMGMTCLHPTAMSTSLTRKKIIIIFYISVQGKRKIWLNRCRQYIFLSFFSLRYFHNTYSIIVSLSHSSSVYLEIKLTEEVARDKQSCFFFRKQVRLQETLTPKKLLILALQEAERNGNSIYIICLIRVEDSEDEDHTSQVEVLYSSIIRLPKFNLSPSGHSTLGQLAFSYMPVKFKFLRARACTRTSPLNLAIEILKWSEERTNICVMYTLCPVLIKFFSNQCIHIKNKSNV
ncbi:unnamed protein product [Brassica rapa subsp. trilocularis]